MNAKTRALKRYYEHKKLATHSHLPNVRATKSQALEHYKAKRDKKKLPTIKAREQGPQQKAFKRMSIEEYESKYL